MGIGDKSHAILAELQNKARHHHSSAPPGRGLLAKWSKAAAQQRQTSDALLQNLAAMLTVGCMPLSIMRSCKV